MSCYLWWARLPPTMDRKTLMELRRAQGKSVGPKSLTLVATPRVGQSTPPKEAAPGEKSPQLPPVVVDLSALPDKKLSGHGETPRALQAAVVALRLKGYTTKEVGKELGLGDLVIRRALMDARRHTPIEDLALVLDDRAIPEAIDGLIELLESRDKDAIFETLKGRGLFRNHQAVKQDGAPSGLTLNVAFVMPEGRPVPALAGGAVIGLPRDDIDAPLRSG